MRWPGLPTVGSHRPLLAALAVDALGTGLFLPFSVLLFTATTTMSLPTIGLALSLAAVARLPATIGAGVMLDRIGPKRAMIVANLLQAAGFAGYLLVGSFPFLVTTAVVVQLGNSLFWVTYPALVNEVAGPTEQERWFGLVNGLRAAGVGAGGLAAAAGVAAGGVAGYRAIVVVNAVSYLVATALLLRDPADGGRRTSCGSQQSPRWATVLRDRAFLGFIALCFGFTYLSLAFPLAAPVYVVHTLGMPPWAPGPLLASNAILAAIGAAPVVAALTGRRRWRVLVVSQISVGLAYAGLLAMAHVPRLPGVGLAVVTVLLVVSSELVQGPTVGAIVNDAASDHDRGRYIAVYQLTFSVVDIVAPVLLTFTLARGAAATWVPLIGLAALDIVGLLLLARGFPALRRAIGDGDDPAPLGRVVEADGF